MLSTRFARSRNFPLVIFACAPPALRFESDPENSVSEAGERRHCLPLRPPDNLLCAEPASLALGLLLLSMYSGKSGDPLAKLEWAPTQGTRVEGRSNQWRYLVYLPAHSYSLPRHEFISGGLSRSTSAP